MKLPQNLKDIRLSLVVVLFVVASFNAFMFGLSQFSDISYYLFAILVPIAFGIYIAVNGKKETTIALASMIISIFWFIGLGFYLPMSEFSFLSVLVYFWRALQGFVMLIIGIYLMPKTQ